MAEAELQRMEDLDHALNLARRYYEKLIPPSHRFELRPLRADIRVDLLANSLDTIKVTKGVSLKAVFELLPQFLGLCLPETLRKIADFRAKVAELQTKADKNESELLLSTLGQLVAGVLEQHAGSESSDVLRRLMRVSSEHPTYYEPKAIIDLGGLSFWRSWEEWRSLRLQLGHLSITGLPVVELKRYVEDTDLQESERSLPRDAAALAMLLSFVGPHLDPTRVDFKAADRNEIASPVTFSMTIEAKTFQSKWPRPFPRDGTKTWKPFEFERIMAQIHTKLDKRHPSKPGSSELSELLLEHLALNYVRIANHLFDASLGDPPPALLFPEGEDGLAEAWRGALAACSAQAPAWNKLGLPQLAFPESGLSEVAAARLLSAWSETMEDATAALESVERQREMHIETEARKGGPDLLAVQLSLKRLIPRHPWLESTGSVPLAASERLEAALAEIPLMVEDPRASWLPKNAAGYLDSRVRGLVQRAASFQVDNVTRALTRFHEPVFNRIPVLFEAWKASRPPNVYLLTETDFTITSKHQATPYAITRFTETSIKSAEPNLEFSLSLGALHEPDGPLVAKALFRIVFDYAHDNTALAHDDPIDWPLMKVYWRNSNHELQPWPAPRWPTHLDHELMNQHWEGMCLIGEHSEDTTGVLARRYIAAQLNVFTSRAGIEDTAAEVPAWPELFERVRAAYEATVGTPGPRARIFRSWMDALHRFGWASSALPFAEAAAAYCAYLEVLLPEGQAGNWALAGDPISRMRGHEYSSKFTAIHKNDIKSHQARRHQSSELREAFEDQFPALFAVPREREGLVTKLRSQFEVLIPENSLLTLSEELLTLMRRSYSGDLRRLLHAVDELEDTLDWWNASEPRDPELIRRRGDQLMFRRQFEYEPDVSKPADFPMARDLLLQAYRGQIDININENNLSTVLYYFLHDLADDARGAGVHLDPIEWPFWVVEQIEPLQRKWNTVPAVQWSAFIDMSLQLRAWHEALDRRVALNSVEGYSAPLLRDFVAATAHIFRTRQPYTAVGGSWREVIHAARTALVESAAPEHRRTRGYEAWVSRIPRLALPSVGLANRHAADVLVRYYDITRQDPRPQLKGRINSADRYSPLFGDEIVEHPAARVAESEGQEGLETILDALRAEYELG